MRKNKKLFLTLLFPALISIPFLTSLSCCSNIPENLPIKAQVDLIDVSLYYNFNVSTDTPVSWIKYDSINNQYIYDNNGFNGNSTSFKGNTEVNIKINPTVEKGNNLISLQYLVQFKKEWIENKNIQSYNSIFQQKCYSQSGIYDDINSLADSWWVNELLSFNALRDNMNFKNNNFYFFEKYIDQNNNLYQDVLLINSVFDLGEYVPDGPPNQIFNGQFFNDNRLTKHIFALERNNPQFNLINLNNEAYQIIWSEDINNIIKFNKVSR